MQTSAFKFYSKGIAAEDLKLGDDSAGELLVFAEEHHTTESIEITEEKKGEEKKGNISTGGKNMGTTAKTTNSLPAKWLNMGSPNRVTPPFVKKGEALMIYKFGESDKYFWSTMFTEMDIRKKEAVLHVYSNTDEHGKTPDKSTSYWTLIDTIKKRAQLHMADNDGEVAGYDFIADGLKGEVSIADTKGNVIKLTSSDGGTLDIAVGTVNFNTKQVNFNNGSCKFGAVVDFLKKVTMNGNAHTMTCPKGVTTKVK